MRPPSSMIDFVSFALVLLLLMMPHFPRLATERGRLGDLPTPTSWWLEQVVNVDFLEWEG